MSTNSRLMTATPEKVWEVLADGWLYPVWVVGASRMREVDDHWPEVGSKLHHSVGVWPALIDDDTEVLQSQQASLLQLRARAWPGGEAQVTIHLRPQGSSCEVTIEEDVVRGPGVLVPKPVRDLPLAQRNDETLQRLAYIVENR